MKAKFINGKSIQRKTLITITMDNNKKILYWIEVQDNKTATKTEKIIKQLTSKL